GSVSARGRSSREGTAPGPHPSLVGGHPHGPGRRRAAGLCGRAGTGGGHPVRAELPRRDPVGVSGWAHRPGPGPRQPSGPVLHGGARPGLCADPRLGGAVRGRPHLLVPRPRGTGGHGRARGPARPAGPPRHPLLRAAAHIEGGKRGRAGTRAPLEHLSPANPEGPRDLKGARQRPTLPPGYPGSTIGAGGLNFRVRKGNGCLPSAIVTEPGNYTWLEVLPRAAAAGAKALDLAGLRRRDVVRTASHLAHESLFLHLAAELAQRLLELLWILDDYSHNPTRIQAPAWGLLPLPDGREA